MTRERRPVNGRVVVDEITEEKKTAGGIILMEKDVRGRLKRGKVKLVDSLVTEAVGVKENDTVYYRPGAGYDIPLDEKTYLIMKATDLELVET
jgi:co-chaperonin GroES (HSP10)